MNSKNKKSQKSNRPKRWIFLLLICISTFFMSIGYAKIDNINLEIAGDATATPQNGIFITDVVDKSTTNADSELSEIVNMYQTILTSNVVLSEEKADSSITYTITVYNRYDLDYRFTGVVYDKEFYTNDNITFELSGIKIGDKIESKNYLTFDVTFKYVQNVDLTQEGFNNALKSILNFTFERDVKPVLANKMVPVYNESGLWKKTSDSSENWHNYYTGNWANALTYNHELADNLVENEENYKVFEGTTEDYKYLGSENYDFGNDITLAARVKITKYGDTGESQLIVGNVESAGFYLGLTSTNKIRFRIYTASDVYYTATWDKVINLNTWYNIVATYDGNNMKLYVNGELKDTEPVTENIFVSEAPIVIGGNPKKDGTVNGAVFNGIMSEVIVLDDTLTQSEIVNNYGNIFTPELTNHNVLYHIRFYDNVGKVFNGTSEDYIYLGSENYDFGNNITVVTKFKIFEYGTEIKGLVGNVESAGFYMGVTTGGKIRFRFYESADVNKNLYSQEAIKLDTWYTVVLTYDGSTLKLYCNGVLEDSLECTSKISKSAAPIMIGGNPNAEGITTSGFFEGVISEMIIMTEPLTEGEVIKSYGETLKHIPTSHNVLYYLKFNSDDGIVCNGAAYKEDGMHFDGSDDYISAGLSSYDFKNTFTIGARVKLNAYSDNEYTIFGNPQSAGFNLFKRKDNKLGISVYDQNTSDYINQYTSFIPELNTWYTLMATYDGTKLSLYVNGEEHTSIETTIGTKVCTTPFMVGVNANLNSKLGGCYLNGVVSDVILIDEVITAEQIKTNYSTSVRNIISDKTLIAYDLRGYEGREDGTTVPNKMIKTMWVWLPRFKADTPTSLGMIKTKIVGVNDEAHDAFTLGNEELQGFWVGKYENKTNLILDNIPESILIKPQENTWTNSSIGNMYNEIKNITLNREKYGFDPNDTKTLDTHMIKNSEWAAISYLTHSKCGISRNGTYVEVKEGNSNTGNESGIYAMAGGVSEFVMGNYNVTTNTNFEILPDTKYFDKYTTQEDYENKKLQHALFETNGIYNNSTMNFIDESNMWLIRDNLFSYSNSTGEANANIGSRSILIVK